LSKGRKRKPTNVLKLEGNRGKRKLRNVPKPVGAIGAPPRYFDRHAKEMWKKVLSWWEGTDVIQISDQVALEAFCIAYSDFRNSRSEINKKGRFYETPNGYITEHPRVWMFKFSVKMISVFGNELGLSPAAREKLAGTSGYDDNDELENMFKAK